ncbi:MAG: ATP-binding cassette domain-containing protein [Isosphaeraceae bacterium]|nr:ATP-binding cassette domain-containing protein [Isosphaeraceae bacterium]
MSLLMFREVGFSYGGPRLLDGIDLAVEAGERICVLGRNGEGKSTLLRMVEGSIQPESGEIIRRQGLRITRLPQEVPPPGGRTVAAEVALGLADEAPLPLESDYRILSILSRVGLEPDLPFDSLSSGMTRRALLARTLVAEPDILLLDEPTNHLDIDSIRWLEDFLPRIGVTLLFVTHDRAFLKRIATRIVELDRGRLFDWACDYSTFLARKEDLLAAEERRNDLFDKKLAQEEVWIRKGVEARRTRNEGRVRALEAMRAARKQRRDRQGLARIQAQESEKSGALVVEAKGAGFDYGDRTIIRDLTTTVMRGDKVGIVGPNGAGKTTLLDLLLGRLQPSRGSVRLGTNLEIAVFDQLKKGLDEERTVQQNVSDYEMITIDGKSRHILGYLQDFLFSSERARTLVKFLSGGERSRLLLAKLFTKPSNLLILDEPTNDLDLETLELLAGLLVAYQGTVLLVSHDRAFLEDVVTSTLVFQGEGRFHEYDGAFDYDSSPRTSTSPSDPKPSTSAAPTSAPASRSRKLSYKEKKELDELPARIEMMEAERVALHETMADPAFYRKPGDQITLVTSRLAELESELSQCYERWESLEQLAG